VGLSFSLRCSSEKDNSTWWVLLCLVYYLSSLFCSRYVGAFNLREKRKLDPSYSVSDLFLAFILCVLF
jgi:hypothetical protein